MVNRFVECKDKNENENAVLCIGCTALRTSLRCIMMDFFDRFRHDDERMTQ